VLCLNSCQFGLVSEGSVRNLYGESPAGFLVVSMTYRQLFQFGVVGEVFGAFSVLPQQSAIRMTQGSVEVGSGK